MTFILTSFLHRLNPPERGTSGILIASASFPYILLDFSFFSKTLKAFRISLANFLPSFSSESEDELEDEDEEDDDGGPGGPGGPGAIDFLVWSPDWGTQPIRRK